MVFVFFTFLQPHIHCVCVYAYVQHTQYSSFVFPILLIWCQISWWCFSLVTCSQMDFQFIFWFRCSLLLFCVVDVVVVSLLIRVMCAVVIFHKSFFCGFNCCFIIHTRTVTYKYALAHTQAHSPKTTTTATTTTNLLFCSGFTFNERLRRTFRKRKKYFDLFGQLLCCFSLLLAFCCP